MQIRSLVLVGIMLSIVTGVTLGATLFREQQRAIQNSANDKSGNANLFNKLLAKVRSNYYQELTDEQLLDGAFNGVMATLDEHSRFLDADDINNLAEDTSGRFGGVGVEVGVAGGELEIVRPMPDTPADQAGILAGDIITGVDDYHITDGDLSGAMNRLRGAPGTPVTIHLRREQNELSVELTRAEIRINSVRSRLLEPGYGYLRISQFRSGTETDVKAALAGLKTESGGPGAGSTQQSRRTAAKLCSGERSVPRIRGNCQYPRPR